MNCKDCKVLLSLKYVNPDRC